MWLSRTETQSVVGCVLRWRRPQTKFCEHSFFSFGGNLLLHILVSTFLIFILKVWGRKVAEVNQKVEVLHKIGEMSELSTCIGCVVCAPCVTVSSLWSNAFIFMLRVRGAGLGWAELSTRSRVTSHCTRLSFAGAGPASTRPGVSRARGGQSVARFGTGFSDS